MHLIAGGEELTADTVAGLARAVEAQLLNAAIDRVAIHQELGKAIFARSDQLFSGEGLPGSLAAWDPPVIR